MSRWVTIANFDPPVGKNLVIGRIALLARDDESDQEAVARIMGSAPEGEGKHD